MDTNKLDLIVLELDMLESPNGDFMESGIFDIVEMFQKTI